MKEQNLFLCILSHGVNSSKYDLELLESKIEKLFNSSLCIDNKEERKKDNYKEKKFKHGHSSSINVLLNSNIENNIYIINSNCNSYIKSHYSIEVLAKNLLNEVKQKLETEIFPSFEKKIISKYTNSNENDNNSELQVNNKEKLNETKKIKYNEEEKKILFEECQCNLYISVLGHSLGGLIMRYFIKLLYDTNSNINNAGSSIENVNDEIYNSLSFIDCIKQKHSYIKRIIPCSYISVSSPHLGSCIPSIQTGVQLKSKITNGFQSLVFSTILGESGRELNIPKSSLLGNILWRNNNNNASSSKSSSENSSKEGSSRRLNLLGNNGRSGSRLGLRLLLRKDTNNSNNNSTESLNKDSKEPENDQDFNDFKGIESLNNSEFLGKLEKFPCRTLIGCLRNDCFVRYVSALATVIDPNKTLKEEKKLISDYKEDVKLISYSGFEEEGNDEMNAFYQKRLFEPKYPLNIVDKTTEKVENPDITGEIKRMIDELNEEMAKNRRNKKPPINYNNIDDNVIYVDKENNNEFNLKIAKAINTLSFRRLSIDFQTYNYILQLMTHGFIIGKNLPCDSRTKELMNKMVNYIATLVIVDYLWISKQTNIPINNY